MKKAALANVFLIFLLISCDKEHDDEISNFDKSFIIQSSMINTGEINAGQTILKKASDPAVKNFGQLMIADYSDARERLTDLTSELGISLADSLDVEHATLITQLTTLSGRALDSVYIHSEIKNQQKVIALCNDEAAHGRNDELRNYAAALLPTLQEHLSKSDSLAAKF